MSDRTAALQVSIDRLIARVLLGVASILFALWFANIPIYVNGYIFPPLTPVHWVLVTLLLVLAIALANDDWTKSLNSSFVTWWIAAVALNLTWYIGWGGGDPIVMSSRITAFMFLAAAYFAFDSSPALRERVCRAM